MHEWGPFLFPSHCSVLLHWNDSWNTKSREHTPEPEASYFGTDSVWHWGLSDLVRATGVTAEEDTRLSQHIARKLHITCSGSTEALHGERLQMKEKGKPGMLISPKHTCMQKKKKKTSHYRQTLPAFFLSVSLVSEAAAWFLPLLLRSHFPLSFFPPSFTLSHECNFIMRCVHASLQPPACVVLLTEALLVNQKTLSHVNKALLNYPPSRHLLKHPHRSPPSLLIHLPLI